MKASTCMGNVGVQPLCRLLNSVLKTENIIVEKKEIYKHVIITVESNYYHTHGKQWWTKVNRMHKYT